MIDTNVWFGIGRLTSDPELKYTAGGNPVCNFSIAVNRDFKDKKDVSFIDVIAWSKLAETICQFMKKGKRIAITGHLKQSRWQDKDGGNRSKIEIVAESVQFLDYAENKTKTPEAGQVDSGQNEEQEHFFGADEIPQYEGR